MKKRITALLLLLTLSVTSLFACTSADKSESASDKTAKTSKSTSTKKQELTPVTLNEVAHSIFYAPMYVAIEKGYFANEGIDLSLVTGFGCRQNYDGRPLRNCRHRLYGFGSFYLHI